MEIKELKLSKKMIDITGRKFGKLLVVRPVGYDSSQTIKWECICDCGNKKVLYSGIDRIDSTVGYQIENVVPCCKTCNFAKNCMSQKEFYGWIEKTFQNLQATGKLKMFVTHKIDFSKIWE